MHFPSKKKNKNKNKKKQKNKKKIKKKKKKCKDMFMSHILLHWVFVVGFIIGGLGEIFMRDELRESSSRSFVPWIAKICLCLISYSIDFLLLGSSLGVWVRFL